MTEPIEARAVEVKKQRPQIPANGLWISLEPWYSRDGELCWSIDCQDTESVAEDAVADKEFGGYVVHVLPPEGAA